MSSQHPLSAEQLAFVATLHARGPSGLRGILRRSDPDSGAALTPWAHQARLAKSIFEQDRHSLPAALSTGKIVLWGVGSGKTNAANLVAAAAWSRAASAKSFRVIYSVPGSVIPQWRRSVRERLSLPDAAVLVAYDKQDLTAEAIAKAKVVITTHSCLEAAFRNSHEIRKVEVSGRMVERVVRMQRPNAKQLQRNPQWDPASPPPHHPFFADLEAGGRWSLAVWDEAEDLRSRKSFRGILARQLFAASAYRLVLTATPVGHRPVEFANILHALAVEPDEPGSFARKDTYLTATGALIESVVREAHRLYVDFVSPAELNRPPRADMVITHEIGLPPSKVDHYNGLVDSAGESLAVEADLGEEQDDGSVSSVAVNNSLIVAIHRLEQAAVHWRLMEVGSERLTATDVAYCADHPSEAMQMLLKVLLELQAAGRERVLVHCQHTSVLAIARAYLDKQGTVGKTFLITGEQKRPGGRDEIVTAFLSHPGRAVLLVSAAGASSLCIDAGCESVVLMGTAQWSPSDYQQAVGRVDRCTQAHKVLAIQLRARGSASAYKLTQTVREKRLRAMLPFNGLDFQHLRGVPAEELGFEGEQLDDAAEEMPWARAQKWMRSLPALEADGCAPFLPRAVAEAAQFGSLADAPDGVEEEVKAVLRGKKRASEYDLSDMPPRGVSRFA